MLPAIVAPEWTFNLRSAHPKPRAPYVALGETDSVVRSCRWRITAYGNKLAATADFRRRTGLSILFDEGIVARLRLRDAQSPTAYRYSHVAPDKGRLADRDTVVARSVQRARLWDTESCDLSACPHSRVTHFGGLLVWLVGHILKPHNKWGANDMKLRKH